VQGGLASQDHPRIPGGSKNLLQLLVARGKDSLPVGAFCNHGDLSFVAFVAGKTWEVLHQFLASWSDFFGEKWELHGNPQKNGVWVPPTPAVGRVEAANQSLGKRNIHRVTPLLLLRPGKVMNTRVQQQMMANRMPIRTVYFSQLEILRQNFVSVLRYEIYHSPTSK